MVVDRFLEWMETAPAHLRAEAVAPLVRRFFVPALCAHERSEIEAALTVLLDDPAICVRRALAEALAVQDDAPRHLIVALLHDLPSIAEVLFRRSPCILDSELVEAVARGSERVSLAIARRPWVSGPVCAALIACACRDAVVALLKNGGADLDATSLDAAATRFGADPPIRDALFAREDLPLSVRQSLVAALGSRLGDLLTARSWMPDQRARSLVREACEKATVQMSAKAGDGDIQTLVSRLRQSGQLTTALLIRSIMAGNIRLFCAALEDLTGVPGSRVKSLVLEGRRTALTALFAKSGLPVRSHATFLIALDAWRDLDDDCVFDKGARGSASMGERVLRHHDADDGEADDIRAMLRRLASDAAREAARLRLRQIRLARWTVRGRIVGAA